MKEGIKEKDFVSLDDTFQGDEKVQETGSEVVDTELPEEKDEQTAPETSEKEKSWSDLSLPDLENLSRDEIAKRILQERTETAYRNKLYGEQANELGELRKKVEGLSKPEEKKDVLNQIPDMTEGDVVDFNTEYTRSPIRTLLKHSKPHIDAIVQEKLSEMLGSKLNEQITGEMGKYKDAMDYQKFFESHEDAEEVAPTMQIFDEEKHLGKQQRSYEDLYGISKLALAKDPLYSEVYKLMAKHSTVSFAEAKELASLRTSAGKAAHDARQDVENKVAAIDTVTTNAKTKASDNRKPAKNIDEVFEAD